jgi:hypothetical protein
MAENNTTTRKWGEGALSAYGRQGLEEWRRFMPYADSPFAAPTDFGMPGMATQGEIAQARREESQEIQNGQLEAYSGISSDDRGPDDPGLDPD